MEERPPFPKKETEICKLSCESMAGLRAAAPPPPIKSNDLPGRAFSIMMSPATSNLSSNSALLPPFISSQLFSDQHLQGNPSSILIHNRNPNSIGSPNPNTIANHSFRNTSSVSNPLNYHTNPNYEKIIGSCRFKKAEQSPIIMPKCSTSNIASSRAERSPVNSAHAQPMKDHYQVQVDDLYQLGQAGSEDQMMSGRLGLLPAHAYSPWIMSWADDKYEEAAAEAGRTRSRCDQYPSEGAEEPSMPCDDRDRPLQHHASAFASAAAPISPASRVDGPSSPSSSASELLHSYTSAVEDTTSSLTPLMPAAAPAAIEDEPVRDQAGGVDDSQGTTADHNKPPLKQQRRKGQKRVREARVALVTKSEVEHLEDGYRWRKYGQKAVKNSPHPRSYYRCTNSKCFVKKRVERCSENPSHVVTTYEGQHTHHSPALIRGSIMQPDANYPTNVTFVPWQSSLISPNLHFPSILSHNQLISRPPLPSPPILSSFPHLSNSVSFPAAHFPLPPQIEGAQGHVVINPRHNNFLLETSDRHDPQRLSSFVHVRPVASAMVQTPLIDKGLLHDMLPHPCMHHESSPTSST